MTDSVKIYRVSYRGFIVDVHENALNEALEDLSQSPRSERKHVLRSVENALEKAERAMQAGKTLSAEERANIADDVAIWFANEVRQGRAEQAEIKLC